MKNAAGYHPIAVTPSTTNGAPFPQRKMFTRTRGRKIKCPRFKLRLAPHPKTYTIIILYFYVTIPAIVFLKFDWPKIAGRVGRESNKREHSFSLLGYGLAFYSSFFYDFPACIIAMWWTWGFIFGFQQARYRFGIIKRALALLPRGLSVVNKQSMCVEIEM